MTPSSVPTSSSSANSFDTSSVKSSGAASSTKPAPKLGPDRSRDGLGRFDVLPDRRERAGRSDLASFVFRFGGSSVVLEPVNRSSVSSGSTLRSARSYAERDALGEAASLSAGSLDELSSEPNAPNPGNTDGGTTEANASRTESLNEPVESSDLGDDPPGALSDVAFLRSPEGSVFDSTASRPDRFEADVRRFEP